MKIVTHFNLGDQKFVLYNNVIHLVTITGITINVTRGYHTDVAYKVRFNAGGEALFDEHRLFSSKSELFETL